MEKYAILLAYFDKQMHLIEKLYKQIIAIDLSIYPERFVFSLKTQHFYTAIEDLLKQAAKTFENHIEDLGVYHKGLLRRMQMDIEKIRPALLSKKSFLFLDKLQAFRHFIRHAYDCELDQSQLKQLQDHLIKDFFLLDIDIKTFVTYLKGLL